MHSPFPHAWTWIRSGLHVLTAVLMAVVVANAWGSDTRPRWPELVAAGVVSVVYLVGMTRPVIGSHRRSLVWLLVLVGAWLVLLWQVPDALFLAFPLYFLAAHLLPDRWAVLAVAGLAAVGVAGFAAHRGFSVAVAIGPVLGAVVALGTVLGLRAVDRESARRGVLEERERLAREIHDTLAQGFASINLLLGAAGSRLAPQAGTDDNVAAAAELVDRARDMAVANLAEARRFVQALAPSPMAQTALVETLRRTVAELGPAEFTVDGIPREIGPEHEVALLRITREALTNAHRYARADRIAVTLSWLEDAVALDVVDNGVGFDTSQRERGFGLRSMRSRAGELSGQLEVESSPGHGTAVSVSLPLVGAR